MDQGWAIKKLLLITPWKGTENQGSRPEWSELKFFSETTNDTAAEPSKDKEFKPMPTPYFYQLVDFTVPALQN